jgi:hypothetical protein
MNMNIQYYNKIRWGLAPNDAPPLGVRVWAETEEEMWTEQYGMPVNLFLGEIWKTCLVGTKDWLADLSKQTSGGGKGLQNGKNFLE